jgi:hypothetical protein
MILGVGKANHTPRCRQTSKKKMLENKTKLTKPQTMAQGGGKPSFVVSKWVGKKLKTENRMQQESLTI